MGGFNREGLDADRYDVYGFNREGFDREGLGADRYDVNGFNREGFDREGLDADRYDVNGFNRQGFDRGGRDPDGFDRQGYDREGYDANGLKYVTPQYLLPRPRGTWTMSDHSNNPNLPGHVTFHEDRPGDKKYLLEAQLYKLDKSISSMQSVWF